MFRLFHRILTLGFFRKMGTNCFSPFKFKLDQFVEICDFFFIFLFLPTLNSCNIFYAFKNAVSNKFSKKIAFYRNYFAKIFSFYSFFNFQSNGGVFASLFGLGGPQYDLAMDIYAQAANQVKLHSKRVEKM
jgi:hypothetical protein